MGILRSLVGFGSTEEQAKYPPVLAWLGLLGASYLSAEVIEFFARLMPAMSVYFRTVGVFAVALLAQAFVRFIIYRDGLSWSGWLRERFK